MSNDKAPVAQVKAAVADAIDENPGMNAYSISVLAFEMVYLRKYLGKPDRPELERIKWHAKRMLAGETGEWGGKRTGAGHRKQATEQEVSE